MNVSYIDAEDGKLHMNLYFRIQNESLKVTILFRILSMVPKLIYDIRCKMVIFRQNSGSVIQNWFSFYSRTALFMKHWQRLNLLEAFSEYLHSFSIFAIVWIYLIFLQLTAVS
jgi:hypothetical protein